MSHTHRDLRAALELLWGEGGAFAADTFAELNHTYFEGRLPVLPIVIGLTGYGRCLGLTRSKPGLPRITLASGLFRHSRLVEDTLLHEMVHAELILAGRTPQHNSQAWCERISQLSPAVLGHAIQATPVKTRRIDGKVVR